MIFESDAINNFKQIKRNIYEGNFETVTIEQSLYSRTHLGKTPRPSIT